MNILIALSFLVGVAGFSNGEVDQARLAAELAADADVVRSLRSNGDIPAVVRPIDVRFIGPAEAIAALEDATGALGLRVVQQVAQDDGSIALDVQRDQSTETDALEELTRLALEIEVAYGVHYEGWGTVAQTSERNVR